MSLAPGPPGPFADDLELAERAARAAGEVLLARFGAPAEGVESKSSETDPVSEADREAERVIAELLRSKRPDDGRLGEEAAADVEGTSGRRWVVDPLDGTVNYLYGLRAWCVSVALEDGEGVAVGVICDPLAGEIFSAVRSGGAWRDGARLAVNEPERLATALIATGFAYEPEVRGKQAQALTHVVPRVRDVRRGGSAALDLAYVAAGRVDGYFERGGHAWDWAAGRLLVLEAGGELADLDGSPSGLAAASPGLLEALVDLVREAEARG